VVLQTGAVRRRDLSRVHMVRRVGEVVMKLMPSPRQTSGTLFYARIERHGLVRNGKSDGEDAKRRTVTKVQSDWLNERLAYGKRLGTCASQFL
jgi:hypothetical protein